MNQTKTIISELKDNNEDFEFYPTSKEMIKCIFNNIENSNIDVLDIGCGTCNFKNFYEEISTEKLTNYLLRIYNSNSKE